MNSSLQVKRTFLPPGYRAEYHAVIECPHIYLPKLIDASFRQLIDPLVLRRTPIVNLKGRDQRNLIESNIPVTFLPTADEFCFAAGMITKSPKADKGQEFTIAVNSKFIANEKTVHMLHIGDVERHGFPADVLVESVGRLPALHIKTFRLGFDIFETRFLSSLIGLVPTVSQTLLVEADEKKCVLRIVAEGLKSKAEIPLQRDDIWKRLESILSESLRFELDTDYQKQLK